MTRALSVFAAVTFAFTLVTSFAHANELTVGATLGVDDYSYETSTVSGVNDRDAAVGAFVNYSVDVNETFVVGLQGDVERSLAEVEDKTASNNNLTSDWSYGLSVRPGFRLSENTMLYGIGGVYKTRFDVQSTTFSNEWRTGYGVGGGVQVVLAENLVGRLEYQHRWYDDFTANGTHYEPTLGAIRLGVGYQF